MKHPIHPAAALYPMLPESELAELAKSIRANGLIFPVVIHEGMILDGRNRAEACELAGVEIETIEADLGNATPTEWVLAVNNTRRHLTPSQKAAIAVRALPLLREEARKRQAGCGNISTTETGRSRDHAANLTGANPRYVHDAEKVKEKSPEVFQQVVDGEKSLQDAKREVAIISTGLKRLSSQKSLDAITQKISDFEANFPGEIEILIEDLKIHLDRLQSSTQKAA